jgi:sec-independent protein translocase protein TatA
MGLENPIHLVLILLVVLLVFGAKRLPEMGRSLGDGMRGFKDAISGQPETPSGIQAQAHTQEDSTPASTTVLTETAPSLSEPVAAGQSAPE